MEELVFILIISSFRLLLDSISLELELLLDTLAVVHGGLHGDGRGGVPGCVHVKPELQFWVENECFYCLFTAYFYLKKNYINLSNSLCPNVHTNLRS
jgi:hypothetical protein